MTETSPGGAPPPPPTQTTGAPPPSVASTNGLAVAALVLGILALVFFWLPFLGWIPAVLGLVFGLVAMQRPDGRGMAIAGVVCSGIALALKIWFWIAVLGFFGAVAAHHGGW
jgi:hypothetical protein